MRNGPLALRCQARSIRAGSLALPATMVTVGLLLTGCSQGTSDGTASETSAGPGAASGAPGSDSSAVPTRPADTGDTPAAAGPGRCTSAQLAVSLRDRDAAAGQRHATVALTNTGASCRIEGYGGIAFFDAAGKAVPTERVRDRAVPPEAVVLAPGAVAVSRLSWSVVPGGPERPGACGPVPATLRVNPPDDRSPLSIAWSYGSVCSGSRVEQQAYRAAR